jgi:hypothetical protein
MLLTYCEWRKQGEVSVASNVASVRTIDPTPQPPAAFAQIAFSHLQSAAENGEFTTADGICRRFGIR